MNTPVFRAIVLAGERPGGGALARALGLPAGVLAPLAGRPSILRVMDALDAAEHTAGTVVCGPERPVVDSVPELAALMARPDVDWLAPATGPAASAAGAAASRPGFPLLLTGGDHGLLTAAMVDGFCTAAWSMHVTRGAELVVGLVPHPLVAEAFPASRRTVLRFADGALCGSNLFALLGHGSTRALAFWSSVEADRKRPWRIARRLGTGTLLRYLLGRLPVNAAFETLSSRTGCRISWVPVPWARAAVDVDSIADWKLADRLLGSDAAAAGDVPGDSAGNAGAGTAR